jgi:hypothetical protein
MNQVTLVTVRSVNNSVRQVEASSGEPFFSEQLEPRVRRILRGD